MLSKYMICHVVSRLAVVKAFILKVVDFTLEVICYLQAMKLSWMIPSIAHVTSTRATSGPDCAVPPHRQFHPKRGESAH